MARGLNRDIGKCSGLEEVGWCGGRRFMGLLTVASVQSDLITTTTWNMVTAGKDTRQTLSSIRVHKL